MGKVLEKVLKKMGTGIKVNKGKEYYKAQNKRAKAMEEAKDFVKDKFDGAVDSAKTYYGANKEKLKSAGMILGSSATSGLAGYTAGMRDGKEKKKRPYLKD